MKKIFVSVPMKGRTGEEIKASIQKMKKIAEIYEGEELELIDSYIEDNPPKDSKEAVWYLGESLKKLDRLMCLLEYVKAMIGMAAILKDRLRKYMALKHI
jgi:hypothetical protein